MTQDEFQELVLLELKGLREGQAELRDGQERFEAVQQATNKRLDSLEVKTERGFVELRPAILEVSTGAQSEIKLVK